MKVICNLYPVSDAGGSVRRTGIFRVVEHLILGLAAADGCQTIFQPADHVWQAWRYFDRRLRTPQTSFSCGRWQLGASRLFSPLEKLGEQFVAKTQANRALVLRLLRFACVRGTGGANALLSALDNSLLRESDIYHSSFLPIPPKVKRYRNVRRFTTVYDLIPIERPEFFDQVTVRLAQRILHGLDETDHIFCISEATRDAFLRCCPRVPPSRVLVTPLAAGSAFYPETDNEKLSAVSKHIGLPAAVPYFLSLCTLEPRKNLDSVIRAFARLKAAKEINPETHLVLVGNSGWFPEKISAALEEAAPYRDSILLTGFVPDEHLAALYSGALAFIYVSWMEGFGLPPLEAMQCGIPVICSNTSSLPEVVGDAGLLVPPEDLDAIGSAMRALALNESLRLDLAARARQRAALFSWDRFISQTLDGYRAALLDSP